MNRRSTGHSSRMSKGRVFLAVVWLSSSACGGRIAPAAEGTPAPEGAPAAEGALAGPVAAPGGASSDAYCSALSVSVCSNTEVSGASCATSYAAASDAYRAALIACAASGETDCGYPGGCVVSRLTSAVGTVAQRSLADALCHTCVADAPSADCVDATLTYVGPGETIGLAILVLSDAASSEGLGCADLVGASRPPSSNVCEADFITCLAKYRPIIGQ